MGSADHFTGLFVPVDDDLNFIRKNQSNFLNTSKFNAILPYKEFLSWSKEAVMPVSGIRLLINSTTDEIGSSKVSDKYSRPIDSKEEA